MILLLSELADAGKVLQSLALSTCQSDQLCEAKGKGHAACEKSRVSVGGAGKVLGSTVIAKKRGVNERAL